MHGKVWGFDIDRNGVRTANHTDDTVALLHQPLVVLTDRDCVSAGDAFSDAVKDLHIGTLVGTRTAGDVAGPTCASTPKQRAVAVEHSRFECLTWIPITAWCDLGRRETPLAGNPSAPP